MLKPIESILFATDLTQDSQPALDFTIAVATRFQATIYMLHVMESLPEGTRDKMVSLLGNHKWEELVHSKEESVHKSLLGKQSTAAKVRESVQEFCRQEGINQDSCNFQSREIIISDGDVVEDILKNAESNACDLIVLGGHRNIFSQNGIGSTAKGVLKKSKIAVTVVPGAEVDSGGE